MYTVNKGGLFLGEVIPGSKAGIFFRKQRIVLNYWESKSYKKTVLRECL